MNESRRQYIKNRVIQILTHRDHSEKELTTKLKKYFTPEEVTFALGFAKDFNLIPTNYEDQLRLSARYVESLLKKRQGRFKIQKICQDKGLPPPSINTEQEQKAANDLVHLRCSKTQKLLTKDKIFRYLMSRGFSPQVARLAIQNNAAFFSAKEDSDDSDII